MVTLHGGVVGSNPARVYFSTYKALSLCVFEKKLFINYHPMYSMAGFDLTAHFSAGGDDTTRARRHGRRKCFHNVFKVR
jgi:hypothetical protein